MTVGIVIVASRQIVQPIEQLSQVAQAIRDGDLNAQANVKRTDEIGKMAQVFNSMTARLRQTLKGLQDHVEELEKARVVREQMISLQQAIFEASVDGFLVADAHGTMVGMNRRFIEMWDIPADIIASKDDNRAIQHVLDQLVDPSAFVAKVTALYQTPDAESYDILEFKDGRFFERYSKPQH